MLAQCSENRAGEFTLFYRGGGGNWAEDRAGPGSRSGRT